MSYLEELLPEFKKGAKIRIKDWDDGVYLLFDTKEKIIIDQEGKVCEFTPIDIICDKWEFYQDSEPDWNYIIKNKCLCWFWDNESNIVQNANCLKEIRKDLTYRFITNSEHGWKHCRPVHKDEVTFYEERNDERRKN